jgi:hypothetical protein
MGAAVDLSMARLGTPPMPWQRYANAIANEVDPARPKHWRYDLVVVTVPRQAGKTIWETGNLGHRIIVFNNHHSLMTAQTGKDARKRWDSLVTAFDAKKKTHDFKVRESSGSESLKYLPRNSDLSPFAPTPKSVHGDTKNDIGIDEAWAFDSVAGHDLETAVAPTQLTVPDSQLIIVSTRGTAKSTWLNALIEKGRASVGDPDSRMAYLEFSADPAAAARDPFSDETLSFHPAVGHTQDLDKIRALYTGDLAAWYRSILNLESPVSEDAIIDLAIWDRLSDDHPGPVVGRDYSEADEDHQPRIPDISGVHVAYDVALDRSGASVVGAWIDGDGLHLQVLRSQDGSAWLAPMVRDLQAQGYASVSSDDAGPTRTVTEDLRDVLGASIAVATPKEYASACQLILDRAKDGDLTHDAHPTLRRNLQVARIRYLGGAIAFDAQRSAGPIDTLRAAALAAYRATQSRATGLNLFTFARR